VPTIQHILQEHFDALMQAGLSAPQYRAARAMLSCRTAALGGHVERCPHGHVERVWYNSCRHRACPQCNALAKERWVARTRARLIDCGHWHVIFTIPHQLNVLWRLNTPAMMDALFAAARDTLLELLSDPRYLGAQPGMQLALHTWSRALALHPHIHALVSDGGMRDGVWVAPRRSHFLPAKVVMMLFRGKLLDALRGLHRRGELRLPEQASAQMFASLLNRLGRKLKWNVRVCSRYAHGRGVSAYLARYVRGGPLRNTQIVRANPQQVEFRYTAHDEQGKRARACATMVLAPVSFLRRVLTHAPERARHSIRYYGLYAHACTRRLDAARSLHQQAGVQAPTPITWQSYLERFGQSAAGSLRCPHCQAPLVRVASVPARRRTLRAHPP
jgi:hypothetical protein